MSNQEQKDKKKKQYVFGGIKEFDLEKIEAEVLNESMYLEVFAGSDIRFKKNVTPLRGVLPKLLDLDGVLFDWKAEEFVDKGFNNDQQLGFIAQDIQQKFPQLVKLDTDGFLTVNYSKMVPVLLEGMKEMASTIADQGIALENMKKRLDALEGKTYSFQAKN